MQPQPPTGGVHVELIPHRPDNPYPLGRHIQHDPASWNYRYAAPAPFKAETVMWGDDGPILDQGNVGGCVGFTGADILNTTDFDAVRAKFHGTFDGNPVPAANNFYGDADGLNFYHLATTDDGLGAPYPPNDRGSSGLGLAAALQGLGLISSYTHAFGWDDFCAAIAFQPVAVGTVWTSSMFNPDVNGLLTVGDPTDPEQVAGGHEYMIRGINYETERVRMRNHWNMSWGINGEADITFPDFRALLAAQGDVVVLVPAVPDPPTKPAP